MSAMKILVFLQNAWGCEDGYIPTFNRESFCKSHTGKRLKEMLPDDATIIIRNASPLVGIESDSCYQPDLSYVRRCIKEIKPDLILACGINARYAVEKLGIKNVVFAPHPAYRKLSKQMTNKIKSVIEGEQEEWAKQP